MLFSISILLACQLAGEFIARLSGLPLPGPVVGMLLLLIGLIIRGRVDTELDHVGTPLLSHLSLLFVPAGVGVIAHLHRLAQEIVPIVLSVLVSTVLAIAVGGWLTQWVIRRTMGKRTEPQA